MLNAARYIASGRTASFWRQAIFKKEYSSSTTSHTSEVPPTESNQLKKNAVLVVYGYGESLTSL